MIQFWKADFLLVLTEVFRSVLRLRRYERLSVQNRRFRFNRVPVDRKFQVEGIAAINHSSSKKTRQNDLSYGMKIWTNFFFRFVTMQAFNRRSDRRTNGRTEFSSLDLVCISCSAVKTAPRNFLNLASRNFPQPRNTTLHANFTSQPHKC